MPISISHKMIYNCVYTFENFKMGRWYLLVLAILESIGLH